MSQVPTPAPLVLANQPPPTWQFSARKNVPGWNGFGSEIREMLERPFESHQIRRDVKRHTDGFEPVYVDAPTVIQRLNDVFNSDWDFEILCKELVPPNNPTQVIIHGRMTVRHWVLSPDTTTPHWVLTCTMKEQFGSCFLKMSRDNVYTDIGSDYKAAATDALKKCATQFGVALDLYVKDESPPQGLHRTGGMQGQGTFAPQQTNPNAPAEAFQIEAVRKMFAGLNVPDGAWQQQLGLSSPQQVTQGLIQSILSGEHPYVKFLMTQNGQQPGLKASAA